MSKPKKASPAKQKAAPKKTKPRPDHKERFDQLLDDAILGVKPKSAD